MGDGGVVGEMGLLVQCGAYDEAVSERPVDGEVAQ